MNYPFINVNTITANYLSTMIRTKLLMKDEYSGRIRRKLLMKDEYSGRISTNLIGRDGV